MKTVSQLASGKKPVGTTAYMGRAEHLLQCRCNVQSGNILVFNVFFSCIFDDKSMFSLK